MFASLTQTEVYVRHPTFDKAPWKMKGCRVGAQGELTAVSRGKERVRFSSLS